VQVLLRNDFRSFTHPPEAMLAVLDRGGLRRTYEHHGLVWQIAGLERA
jgi:magnesium-protoporphyrin O-methyltransferase